MKLEVSSLAIIILALINWQGPYKYSTTNCLGGYRCIALHMTLWHIDISIESCFYMNSVTSWYINKIGPKLNLNYKYNIEHCWYLVHVSFKEDNATVS